MVSDCLAMIQELIHRSALVHACDWRKDLVTGLGDSQYERCIAICIPLGHPGVYGRIRTRHLFQLNSIVWSVTVLWQLCGVGRIVTSPVSNDRFPRPEWVKFQVFSYQEVPAVVAVKAQRAHDGDYVGKY